MPPALLSAAATATGHVRAANEDRVLDRADRGLWAVADGMGGHQAGDVAASLAIDALEALADSGDAIDTAAVATALDRAHRRIAASGAARGATMGTTVALAIRDGDRLDLCWAGDSRIYRLRGRRAELLTRDHSLVQALVDAGTLAAEQAARHPRANVITRALGIGDALELDSVTVAVTSGDRIVLCTDGVSRSLDGAWPLLADAPDRACAAIIAAALARDGTDNASVVVIAVD